MSHVTCVDRKWNDSITEGSWLTHFWDQYISNTAWHTILGLLIVCTYLLIHRTKKYCDRSIAAKKLSQKYCDQELIGISSLRQAPVIKRTPTISYQGGKPLSSPDGKSNKYFANQKQISNKYSAQMKQR